VVKRRPGGAAMDEHTVVEVTGELIASPLHHNTARRSPADASALDLLFVLSTWCARLFDAAEVALLLDDQSGSVRTYVTPGGRLAGPDVIDLTAPTEGARLVPRADAGDSERWRTEATRLAHAGDYATVHCTRLMDQEATAGMVLVFHHARSVVLSEYQVHAINAVADVTAVALRHDRQARQATAKADQLQRALDTRIVIEQAKGFVAGQAGVGPDVGFQWLRRYARDHNQRIETVARQLLAGEVAPSSLPGDR